MAYLRLYADGSTEHRADELRLGEAAYTAENVPPSRIGWPWRVVDADTLPDEPTVPDRDRIALLEERLELLEERMDEPRATGGTE
jgi:hypothetical protein